MVARTPFISSRSPKSLGDHFMHPTESRAERDETAAYLGAREPGEHQGAVPQLRRDTHPRVLQAFGLDPSRTPTKQEVYAIAAGLRADGKPLARSKHAGRFTTKNGYARRGDAQGHKRTDIIDVMLYPDPTWGAAHANAKTKAGAAIVLSVVEAAADDSMARLEAVMGWTRRGKGGRLGPEPGDMTWLRFIQHTPRPTADGRVAPGLHIHHMTPSVVVTESGHIGAVHTSRKKGFTLGDYFNERLAVRARAAGIEVDLRDNGAGGKVAVVKAVPEAVRTMYARRTEEAMADAQKWVARKGDDWEALPPERKAQIIHAGARKTQAAPRDGMADRALWRAEMAEKGFPPTDVARPRHAVPDVAPRPADREATLMQQIEALRTASIQTALMAAALAEQAKAAGKAPPTPVQPARAAQLVQSLSKAMAPFREAIAMRDLRKAAAETVVKAREMTVPIREYFAKRRLNHALNFIKTAETIQGRKINPEELSAGMRATLAASVQAKEAAMKLDPTKVQAAVQRAQVNASIAKATLPPIQAKAPAAAPAKPVQAPSRPPAKPIPRQPMRIVVSQAEAEVQLRDALRQYGIKPDGKGLQFDGRMHYLPVDGNRGAEKSGAYRAYHDEKGAAAAIYNWKWPGNDRGFVGNWSAKGEVRAIFPEQQAAMAERAAQEKAAREADIAKRHQQGAAKAQGAYSRAQPAAAAHPYLEAKGLRTPEWARVSAKGELVLPIRTAEGRQINAQTIEPDGKKKFVSGAEKAGGFIVVGKSAPDQPVIITEGFATALRIHQATGQGVLAALDAGNLKPAVEAIRAKTDKPIVIAADNDEHLPKREGKRQMENVGVDKAEKVAAAVPNVTVWTPPGIKERLAADKGTDWDDYGAAKGNADLAAKFKEHMAAQAAPKAGEKSGNPWEVLQERGAAVAPKSQAAQGESSGQRT